MKYDLVLNIQKHNYTNNHNIYNKCKTISRY